MSSLKGQEGAPGPEGEQRGRTQWRGHGQLLEPPTSPCLLSCLCLSSYTQLPVLSLHHTNAPPRQACCRRALGRTSWELGELLTERNSEAPCR